MPILHRNINTEVDTLRTEVDILNTDVNDLQNRKIKVEYYEVVPGTSSGNQITIPTGALINLGTFGSSKDAVLTTVDGANVPTWESPRTLGGIVITTSLDVAGNYVFSGTPIDTNLAIVYSLTIAQKDWGNLNQLNIISESEIAETAGEDKNYVHNQSTPTTVWNVAHNLNKRPSVGIVTSAGDEVEGDVKHIDNNNITITFSSPFGGKAYIN